ncbi:MAG: hypothetical protein JXR70_14575 [Spirochaetales bacterium]|nr:hypothetical protein [Spirochaetales bacterium]
MSLNFEKIPDHLAKHITQLAELNGYKHNSRRFHDFVDAWIMKRAMFDKIIQREGLDMADRAAAAFESSMVLLTYSGSFLMVSEPDEAGKREIEYVSLDFRKDVASRAQFKDVAFTRDLELHFSAEFDSPKLQKTSPLMAIALSPLREKKGLGQMIKDIIASFIQVNARLNQAVGKGGLSEREDFFNSWTVLQWFRIGGLEEAVYFSRALLLWHELFDRAYDELYAKLGDKGERDEVFRSLFNGSFLDYVDEYKWLESEKKDFDIGLMKALEEIPHLESYGVFIEDFIKGLK